MSEASVNAFRERSAFPAMFAVSLVVGLCPMAWGTDSDSDGMSDAYESFWGLNPTNAADAALNYDSDTLTNAQEAVLGTDPFEGDSDRDGLPDGLDSNPGSRVWVPWGDPAFVYTNEVRYTWPTWMVSAWQQDGEWQTSPPAWYVPASATDDVGRLHLEVDRTILTNDLVLTLGYLDSSNASLFLDLYDTNQAAVATNLFGNLLTGGGTDAVTRLDIPLETYTQAVGIALRRVTGAVTVYNGLLYVDEDGDGLDAEQEVQFCSSDQSADTDTDGYFDPVEVLVYGTDPADSNSYPSASVSGTVAYSGLQTGLLYVVAVTNADAWSGVRSVALSEPGPFTLADLPLLREYWLKTWGDSDGNGSNDSCEAFGIYPSNPLCLTNNTSGVDLTLVDSDTDGDGMADWWEQQHFGSVTGAQATADADGDSYLNIYECVQGGDPTNATSVPAATRYVSLEGSHSDGFTNWACAATTIQAALDAATNDYEIVSVADGIYTGAGNKELDYGGKALMLVSTGGATHCVLDCEQGGRGVGFFQGEGRTAVFAGFTVRNGFALDGPSYLYFGGAIYCSESSPTLVGCAFAGNEAFDGGGAVMSVDALPAIRNCVFLSNTVDYADTYGGGAISAWDSVPEIENCVMIGNRALMSDTNLWGTLGGAIVCMGGSSARIENCTIAGNEGGAAAVELSSDDAVLRNCVLWGNCPSQLVVEAWHDVTYCDVQGGWTGEGNIDADPLFVAGSWRLSGDSPCIDVGTNNTLLTDWEGEARWDSPAHTNAVSAWDIGADEYRDSDGDGLPDWWEQRYFGSVTGAQATVDADGDGYLNIYECVHGGDPTNATSVPAATRYVSLEGSHGDGFTNWACAATNIQAALDAAANAYEIVMVADGTYTGEGNKNLEFPANPVVLASEHGAATCVIDCETNGRAVHFRNGETQRTVLLGLTLKNGCTNEGAAIQCDSNAAPTIEACAISSNSISAWQGVASGAIVSQGGSPTIRRCVMSGNASAWEPTVWLEGGGGLIEDCVILNNAASGVAGYNGSVVTVQNCVIGENSCWGLLFCDGATGVFQNCTIVSNGCGNYVYGTGSVTLQNCIVWANTLTSYDGGEFAVSCCDVQGGWPGTGNIDAAPRLVGSCYWLSRHSPCIDAGISNALFADWEDERRVDDTNHPNVLSIWDIGADEFVDSDGDGLSDAYERELGTDPADPDPDHDGFGDGDELDVGTDPKDAQSFPITLAGTILYTGIQTGRIVIVASTESNAWTSAWMTNVAATGAYELAWLPNRTSYCVRAYCDDNGNGSNHYWEAWGVCASNPVYAATNVGGLAISLSDPTDDRDGNGFVDWWEMHYFGATNVAANTDPDADGFLNEYEYRHGSSPAAPDSIPPGTRFVSLQGSHTSPYTNWAGAATNIQAALNVATGDSEVILVATGIYRGAGNKDLTFPTNPVTLAATNRNGAFVIDCQTNGRAARFAEGQDWRTVLGGLTIRGGNADRGGAVLVLSNSSPTLASCMLAGNTATEGGGAAWVENGSLSVLACGILRNAADTNSAAGVGGLYVTNRVAPE